MFCYHAVIVAVIVDTHAISDERQFSVLLYLQVFADQYYFLKVNQFCERLRCRSHDIVIYFEVYSLQFKYST
jgi:hypothetical protein